jgi:[ribosomal protein S5]-alanine N-acetyltransferase
MNLAPVTPPELVTPRLLLRPLHDGDAEALLAVFSDPTVMRYWSTPPWVDRVQALRKIAGDAAAHAAGEHLALGIVRRDDGRLIGRCTLFDRAPGCRRAQVGYAVAAPDWGRGFATEAVAALLDHGFDALDLNRVEADIDPRNAASARTLERLGFTREGLLRERWIVEGEVSDSAIYGLLRREWAAGRRGGA